MRNGGCGAPARGYNERSSVARCDRHSREDTTMEPGSYDVFKTDAHGNVRGHKLTSETLKGEIGAKLRAHIEGGDAESGRVEFDGWHFAWFPASSDKK